MSTSIRKQYGFTLVEAMVAVGLVGLLALGGLSVATLLSSSTQYGEEANRLQSLVNKVRNRLKYADICSTTIGGASGLNRGTIDRGVLAAAQQQIQIQVPNLRGGANGTETVLQTRQIVATSRIRVTDLRLTDTVRVDADTWTGVVQMSAESLSGRAYHPVKIANIQFRLSGPNGSSSITECVGPESGVDRAACNDMNCDWTDSPEPSCRCATVNSICPIGEYPISFNRDGPVCRKLGGDPCPANQYLVGIRLGESVCAPLVARAGTPPPVPTANPLPSATPAGPLGMCRCGWAPTDGRCTIGPVAYRDFPNMLQADCPRFDTLVVSSGAGGRCVCSWTPN